VAVPERGPHDPGERARIHPAASAGHRAQRDPEERLAGPGDEHAVEDDGQKVPAVATSAEPRTNADAAVVRLRSYRPAATPPSRRSRNDVARPRRAVRLSALP
jgi:hypothetical protein